MWRTGTQWTFIASDCTTHTKTYKICITSQTKDGPRECSAAMGVAEHHQLVNGDNERQISTPSLSVTQTGSASSSDTAWRRSSQRGTNDHWPNWSPSWTSPPTHFMIHSGDSGARSLTDSFSSAVTKKQQKIIPYILKIAFKHNHWYLISVYLHLL